MLEAKKEYAKRRSAGLRGQGSALKQKLYPWGTQVEYQKRVKVVGSKDKFESADYPNDEPKNFIQTNGQLRPVNRVDYRKMGNYPKTSHKVELARHDPLLSNHDHMLIRKKTREEAKNE